ncbi:MAG: response regulator [Fibrobacter sp.]|jgi:signal transduction histidine kinase|nr:response regulator [Fibrobacter sp.]
MNAQQIKLKILVHKTVLFSALLFVFVSLIGGAIFILSMQQTIRENKHNELTRILDNEKIKLETSIISEINLAVKMAYSPLIQRYFTEPDNAELKKLALEEILSYKKSFGANSIFWISDKDKKYYFDNKYQYTLDTLDPSSDWYLRTLRQKELYSLNVNYDIGIKKSKLWVNIPMKKNGRVIGITGIGIDISAFIDAIYENYKESAGLYFFNSFGEITGAKDITLVETKKKVESEFGSTGAEMMQAAKSLKQDSTKMFHTADGEIGITAIPIFDWYILAISPGGIRDYNTAMTWLFLSVLFVMALILAVFNVFIAKIFKDLVNAVKALKVASKAKNEFLAKMSHEIRTPMNAIIGMTELALRENLPPAAQKQIVTVKRASESLLLIINDILDFSKIESGKLEIVPANYSLSSLISDVVSIVEARLTRTGIRLETEIDTDIPDALVGDEKRVRQILLNILSNAVKYTDKGSVSFVVNGDMVNEDTVVLTINVADTGKGIKPENINKLFNDFVQIDPVANKNVEGTGLGLAITKNLLKAMNGNIKVESIYGKGSIFTVTLPQKITSLEPMGKLTESGGKMKEFTAPYAKVLVVDDIEVNLDVMEGLLLPYRVQVDSCLSGMEAVEKIEHNHYDLIFMDHMMPGMDGVETTKRIRELDLRNPYYRDLPIVALTANAVNGMKEFFMENGFNDFLSKPISVNALNVILEKWIPKGDMR